jgi:predicted ATPase
LRSLPVTSTPLIGREQDIVDVSKLLQSTAGRLVTLTGPAGVGKTRLAIAVAERLGERYPRGAVFVPLAPVVDPALVLARIAAVVDTSAPR